MPGVMRLSFKLCLPLLVLLQASCAGMPGGGRSGFWIDVYRGEPLSYEDMLDDLAEVRVVYLGERHTLERHHAIQERIVTDLTQRGVPLVLGLEQMEAFNQAALDRYHQGEIDFDELAEQTEWVKRWSNYEQYRPILEAARQAGAPILAVDVPSGLDANTGEVPGEGVRATVTVTFVAPKVGFLRGEGPSRVGQVVVADIGLPPELWPPAVRARLDRGGA